MLLGDINQAMTSTFDTDEAVQPLRRSWSCRCWPTGAWSAWSRTAGGATSAGRTATRRWPPRCTATPTCGRRTNRAAAPVPRLLRDHRPVVIPELTPEQLGAMVADAEARRRWRRCSRPPSPPSR